MTRRLLTDWRNPDAYAPLLLADRALIAWEWLRRDAAYRKAFLAHVLPPSRWGLVAFEDPECGVPDARPMWSRSAFPSVLHCAVKLAGAEADLLDLDHPTATSMIGDGTRHCLFSDGFGSIRLDIAGAPSVPIVQLEYRLSSFHSLDRPLATLLRLRRFVRAGRIDAEPVAPRRRARMVMLLRTIDALGCGASQRDIATTLLGAGGGVANWRIEQPDVRSRAQRLVRAARSMAGGGYRQLLGHGS